MNNSKQFRLPLHDISIGTILSEAARAYLYSGNPSAMVSRLRDAVEQHKSEVSTTFAYTDADRMVMKVLQDGLTRLHDELIAVEDKVYDEPPNPVAARVPHDWPVQPLAEGAPALARATCGHCGLSWDDGAWTSLTPTPAGRCPFEYFHDP